MGFANVNMVHGLEMRRAVSISGEKLCLLSLCTAPTASIMLCQQSNVMAVKNKVHLSDFCHPHIATAQLWAPTKLAASHSGYKKLSQDTDLSGDKAQGIMFLASCHAHLDHTQQTLMMKMLKKGHTALNNQGEQTFFHHTAHSAVLKSFTGTLPQDINNDQQMDRKCT